MNTKEKTIEELVESLSDYRVAAILKKRGLEVKPDDFHRIGCLRRLALIEDLKKETK